MSKRTDAAKALRRAIQLGLTGVELDADDLAGLMPLIDPWEPGGKYKRGQYVTDEGKTWTCIKNVNKSDARPSADAEHWAEAAVSGDGVPVWTPEAVYSKGDRVHHPGEDGPVYVSQKNNCQNVEPGSDEKYWVAE